jgi:hypothetical protein
MFLHSFPPPEQRSGSRQYLLGKRKERQLKFTARFFILANLMFVFAMANGQAPTISTDHRIKGLQYDASMAWLYSQSAEWTFTATLAEGYGQPDWWSWIVDGNPVELVYYQPITPLTVKRGGTISV